MPDTNAITALVNILDTKVTFPTRTLKNLSLTFLKQLIDDLEEQDFESTEEIDNLEVALRDYVIESELEDVEVGDDSIATVEKVEEEEEEVDIPEDVSTVSIEVKEEIEIDIEVDLDVTMDKEEEDFNKYLEETEIENDERAGK